MPKRSQPYRKGLSEQRIVNQRIYGQIAKEPSKIKPVFLEDHYGIKKN